MQGPFPESLICRFLILGRLGEQDEVSQDGHHWTLAEDVPELAEGIRKLMPLPDKSDDPEWDEERAKAVLRWLDDRKSPDPRGQDGAPPAAPQPRTGKDRRQQPETVEQYVYREWRGEFERWLRQHHERYRWVWLSLALAVVVIMLCVIFYRPVNPIKVGLQLHASNCEAPPARGVNWSGCIKDDMLLVGADLHGAELVGTRLNRANLRQADLRRANLAQAQLAGADLSGAQLEGAIWTDGRICAAASVGHCR